MKPSKRIATILLLFTIFLSACDTAVPTPDSMDVQNKINAAVAQTLAALSTQVAAVQSTEEIQETPTAAETIEAETPDPTQPASAPAANALPPTATLAKPTNAPGKCTDYASYISDITIPDGTMVPPGSKFVKTWAVRNAGTCTWNPNYSIVWTGGDMKGDSNKVSLTSTTVEPGQTAYISVPFTAPSEFIKYRSFWKLMNPTGGVFGIMDNKGTEQSIWAEIVIGLSFDFTSNICSATWTSSAGVLPCPGIQKDPRGFAYIDTAPVIEGGVKENDPAIVMVPPSTSKGYIVGQFPQIVIPEGSNLVTRIGCLEGYKKCNVRFRITYSIDGGPEQEILNQVHGYGEWEGVSINLTQNNRFAMMNRATSFLFYVYAMDGSEDNYAFFFKPVLTP